jgi:hypothetical protein
MVFGTWDLNFGAWEILGYGFQDMVFKTWDLDFTQGLQSGLRPRAPTSNVRFGFRDPDLVVLV